MPFSLRVSLASFGKLLVHFLLGSRHIFSCSPRLGSQPDSRRHNVFTAEAAWIFSRTLKPQYKGRVDSVRWSRDLAIGLGDLETVAFELRVGNWDTSWHQYGDGRRSLA